MTFVAPESAPPNAARIPSIVVLGADALLAALPATPVQLAHACMLAGYHSVIPASWGDELIASASLRALRQRGQVPAIQCSCPHVAHRLLAVGTDLRPFLLSLVSPPVVLARYLRAAHGTSKLRITYVGRCPGAADEAIDARLTPEELLAMFTDRHIALDEQPEVYDSVIPPDRRRYCSQPGGLPTPEMLWTATDGRPDGARSLVELYGNELPVELAQHLLAGKPVLIDCAPKLGCACSGATPGIAPSEARSRIVALEPPRAQSPVVDENIIIDTDLPLPASPRSAIDVVSPPAPSPSRLDDSAPSQDRIRAPRTETLVAQPPMVTPSENVQTSRRSSPGRGIARPAAGALPTARDAGGRQLPRTYVAHRRFPSRTPRSVPLADVAPASALQAGPPPPRPASDVTEAAATLRESELPATLTTAQVGNTAADSEATPEAAVTPWPTGREPNEERARSEPPRYTERAISLPVTRRSDAAPRQEPTQQTVGERPLMQLLTLGLLISMIVLVSAAVGVLVGRWMTQR
jgi:iron only hydrogenase large subunit